MGFSPLSPRVGGTSPFGHAPGVVFGRLGGGAEPPLSASVSACACACVFTRVRGHGGARVYSECASPSLSMCIPVGTSPLCTRVHTLHVPVPVHVCAPSVCVCPVHARVFSHVPVATHSPNLPHFPFLLLCPVEEETTEQTSRVRTRRAAPPPAGLAPALSSWRGSPGGPGLSETAVGQKVGRPLWV